jgi:hypothetical protein
MHMGDNPIEVFADAFGDDDVDMQMVKFAGRCYDPLWHMPLPGGADAVYVPPGLGLVLGRGVFALHQGSARFESPPAPVPRGICHNKEERAIVATSERCIVRVPSTITCEAYYPERCPCSSPEPEGATPLAGHGVPGPGVDDSGAPHARGHCDGLPL